MYSSSNNYTRIINTQSGHKDHWGQHSSFGSPQTYIKPSKQTSVHASETCPTKQASMNIRILQLSFQSVVSIITLDIVAPNVEHKPKSKVEEAVGHISSPPVLTPRLELWNLPFT